MQDLDLVRHDGLLDEVVVVAELVVRAGQHDAHLSRRTAEDADAGRIDARRGGEHSVVVGIDGLIVFTAVGRHGKYSKNVGIGAG